MTIAFEASGTIPGKSRRTKSKNDLDDARTAGRVAAERGYDRDPPYEARTPERDAWLYAYDAAVDADREIDSNNGHATARKRPPGVNEHGIFTRKADAKLDVVAAKWRFGFRFYETDDGWRRSEDLHIDDSSHAGRSAGAGISDIPYKTLDAAKHSALCAALTWLDSHIGSKHSSSANDRKIQNAARIALAKRAEEFSPKPDPEVQEFRQQFDPATPAPSAAAILDIPVEQIDDVGNPRTEFEGIPELADSISQNGLVQPPTVWLESDGRYKLVDGGRRLRAHKHAKLPTMRCYVRERPTAADEAILRLIANDQRDDLNTIERATAYRNSLKPIKDGGPGLTQTELAKRLGIKQPTIANHLRLLELPEAWHKYIANGSVSMSVARDGLAKYLQLGPEILTEAEKILAEWKHLEPPYQTSSLATAIIGACNERFASIQSYNEDHKRLLNSKEVDKFQIVEVDRYRFARNKALWNDRLATLARKREQKAVASKSSHRNETPEDRKQAETDRAEQINKKLFRYLVKWYQRQIAARIPTADVPLLLRFLLHFCTKGDGAAQRSSELEETLTHAGAKVQECQGSQFCTTLDTWPSCDVKDLQKLVRQTLTIWVQHSPEGWRSDMKPSTILAIAADLKIDAKNDWRPEREFLELLTTDQLREVGHEWGHQRIIYDKKNEIVDYLATSTGCHVERPINWKDKGPREPFPKILANVKPCDLT